MWSSFIFNNGVLYRQQLIEQIVDFGTSRIRDLYSYYVESDSKCKDEDNCLLSDSCSELDVDNAEEHKEQSISK